MTLSIRTVYIYFAAWTQISLSYKNINISRKNQMMYFQQLKWVMHTSHKINIAVKIYP
jgi:hypothetical protein